jgi:hypothetical protein
MATNNVINNAFADNFTAPNKVSKNLMPAGNFTTNPWQRGASFAVTNTNTYVADRFRYSGTTGAITCAFTITKDADSPTLAQANIFSNQCLKVACTTAQVSIPAGDAASIYYGVEGYDFTNIAQRTFTFSFWVRGNKTGIYCVSFRNVGTAGSSDRSYVAEYTINASNTWEYKTITVSASPTAGTWDYTNGLGLVVAFCLLSGSTFQTTANAWQTGNFIATSNQVNFADANTNTIQFALMQLEAGTVATPYQILSEGQIRDYCNRYFCSTFPNGTTVAQASGVLSGALTFAKMNTSSSTSGNAYAQTRISMRTSPTVVTYNPINANANWYNVTLGADSGAVQQFSPSYRGINIRNTLVAGDLAGHIIALHVSFSAEL